MVYLLHFEKKYHHAGHYLGWTSLPVEERCQHHRRGVGARLCQVVTQAGIEFEIARTWEGERDLERQLKRRKNSPKLCPICRGSSNG
ncbi:MAG TPA: endonuclease [Anaerolineae bacterium]